MEAQALSVIAVSYIPRYGELTVAINGVRYRYYGVGPFVKDKFEWMCRRNRGRGLAMLRPFECRKLLEDGTWVKVL